MRASDDLRSSAEVVAHVRHMDLPYRIVWTQVVKALGRLHKCEVLVDVGAGLDEQDLQRRISSGEASGSNASARSSCASTDSVRRRADVWTLAIALTTSEDNVVLVRGSRLCVTHAVNTDREGIGVG